MKNPIIFLTAIFLLLIGTAQAQDFDLAKNNYVVLSKNIQQLKPVLMAAKELKKEDGDMFGTFHMIICGKTVADIVDNSDFNVLLKQAKTQNVNVFVCGISLDKFNVDPKRISTTLKIAQNGILRGFQLTKQGFVTLTI